jgi:biopolymer transport protein ExbB/TolQ/DNA-directed RNA polymerase subunit RPC12/RpoP
MYFTFKCPSCGKALKVREEIAGRRCGCPYCNKTIVVPPRPPDLEAPPSELDDLKHLKSTLADRRRPREPGGKSAARQAGGAGTWSTGTDVSMILSGLIGLALAVAFYGLIIPLNGTYIGDMFLWRGWVPYALVFLMSWSVAILFLKSRKLAQQRRSMLFDLLPTDLATEISENTLDKFVRHIHGLPVEPSQSFLVNRVQRGLEHFRVRKNNPETATMLASQSEIDATAVESSYTLLKVFIWAIPILGFIGTVIGISTAVGGFSESLDRATDVAVLKESLNEVTGGLATAFETTLVALVMSLLVMFPTSSMQKAEEDLLNWVDEYCNENLLKRLDDGGGRIGSLSGGSGDVARAIDAALAAQRVELEKWNKTFKSIGSMLTENVVKGWEKINAQMAEQQSAREAQIKQLDRTIEEFQKALAALSAEATKTGQQIASPLGERFAELQRGLESLNVNLERLSEKEVVVQSVPRRRWGWFSRGRDGS